MGLGTKVLGWVLLISTALAFEFEIALWFLASVVLLVAWVLLAIKPEAD